ncbi:helix-turn-helix domain-containing protein [Streptomyces sp. NPDC008137]|uniref:helix-turn-helix domain-containing protein n=1 Tax=Streptomyces sp. NPDC008137 TaxID=3364813 RepID=UPI0036E1FBCC
MVNIGQRKRDAIPRVDFNARVGTPAGVEVMSLSEFRRRGGGGITPQRPDFHHLITTVSGTLKQEVDFTTYDAIPGSWLWVRPGQVQRWGDLSEVEGHLVLFESDFLDPATVVAARLETPGSPVQYDAVVDHGVDLAIEHLCHEFGAVGNSSLDVHIAVLRHLLSVLVLRLADQPAGLPSTTEDSDTFRRFREAVERDFTKTREVADYARNLGYSPRTLTRATASAVGTSAKGFIDERVMLEAKRRLAHSDETAVRVAAHLGFSSATNFSKYFQSRAGQSPIQFRNAARQVPSPQGEP